MTLNINIDHVATIRQARGGNEPDPATAAAIAELAGADGIVCHLREDRRHVQDRDVRIIREIVQTKMDLEMADSEEIIRIALDIVPDLVTIVPEKRQELTTEGGLNIAENIDSLKKLSYRMHERNIEVSFFIEPELSQIEAALEADADMVEFHTGIYANSRKEDDVIRELNRLDNACKIAKKENLKIAAGHGLNYKNTQAVAMIEFIDELSIGHSVISRAVMTGLKEAVKEMKELINKAQIFNK